MCTMITIRSNVNPSKKKHRRGNFANDALNTENGGK